MVVDHEDLLCDHVPERFSWDTLDDVDTSVGPAVAQAADVVARFVRTATMYQRSGPQPSKDDGVWFEEHGIDSVLLSGPVGCGKTKLGAAACNAIAAVVKRPWVDVVDQIVAMRAAAEATPPAERTHDPERYARLHRQAELEERVIERECPRWIAVPTFLAWYRSEIDAGRPRPEAVDEEVAGRRRTPTAVLEQAARARVLVLDDLGAERTTDWSAGLFTELMAQRYDRQLRTIVTSNLSPSALARRGYDRLVSRLAEHGVLLELRSARDYRQRLRRSAVA